MADVVSFRPSKDESAIIERTRRSKGMASRAEAVRYLVRVGGERDRQGFDALVDHHAPPRFRRRRSLRNEEIDDFLYGGKPP